MEVEWKINGIFKADAQKVYEEIGDRKVTPEEVLEKLMSPKKGAPVLVSLNRFVGWSADITIQYLETAFSTEQILNIITLAGFGIGIGSGRSSGYGRYHVEKVETIG